MKRETSEPTLDEHGYEVHPAFGLIGASRVSTSPPGSILFDSDIRHQHSVVVRVSTASRKRDLNRDWLHGTGEFLEVEMSEAQWASFVSSMNAGTGVPCTIRHREGDYVVDAVPYQPRLAESMREVQEATAKTFGAIFTAFDAYEKALEDKVGAVERRKALSNLRTAISHTSSNLSFSARSMTEHAENVVQRARADIEAFVTAKASQLGLDPAVVGSPLELGSAPDAHYCPSCEHPKGYHSSGSCSMPVLPGTNTPISGTDTVAERCGCKDA